MYESLMTLPLFKGISYKRVSEMVGNTRLAFFKYLAGQEIFSAGAKCDRIKFVFAGSVRLTMTSSSERVTISQTLKAPAIIQPDYLFGRNTHYPVSAVAVDTVSIIEIDKASLLNLLREDEIILFNYLNILSTDAQKSTDGMMAVISGSIEERIAFWIISMTQMGSEDIVLKARARDLYTVFGVARSSFMAALDRMVAMGIIEYTANEIKVLSRKGLRDVLLNHPE
ncbi:MAG: Crp/Fnr family transcriptional regulator [Bacteroides sp.]|nr:Crp/Fnr family transcriptional regulator [Bacteroides sp.]